MTAPWFRAATMTPIVWKNRNIIAGLYVLNKTPWKTLYGIGYHTQYMSSHNFDVLKNKSLLCSPICGVRTYSEKTPGPVPPSPPNLPDRAQLEKAFFRVVAFFWDYGLWLLTWMRKMIRLYVVEKPMVKFYWKRFHEKMEEAKKDTKF